MTRKDLDKMLGPPHEEYHRNEYLTLAIFDLRYPGTFDRLCRERASWRHSADIERLDAGHVVLVVRPGGALGARR